MKRAGPTKAQRIRELLADGVSVADIARQLQTSYQYVWEKAHNTDRYLDVRRGASLAYYHRNADEYKICRALDLKMSEARTIVRHA